MQRKTLSQLITDAGLSQGQVLLLAREVAETAQLRTEADLRDWQAERLAQEVQLSAQVLAAV